MIFYLSGGNSFIIREKKKKKEKEMHVRWAEWALGGGQNIIHTENFLL